MLVRYAWNTLAKVDVAQRYGTLLPILVRGVQVLLIAQACDVRRSEGEPARLPGYLPRFLQTLQHADRSTHLERKHGAHAEVVMPSIQDMSSLCILLQRVLEIDVPESEVYDECKTIARTMKDECEALLSQIQAAPSGVVSS
ncbi:uncharacterized protein PHACADRAFT_251102 [Phanerochaete carnosa HHB-10118-sp]|uniref:Uncharacterized protein n=1 Tax=Phanerochaete carnosa (strain HHB-10118-sp) TaxID=650164 RepID=K5W0U3_PHACS|nr:uncharacterized protein PHACADRAFT_251102 [Phanerochaete carnosa HHB-10118-sp]EKM57443.1 hypothetical protein PHACADRAFT_251102 [Phanerochaete carnosa HHB-10118-sp]